MTKKEFLDCVADMPDDAEMVFATSSNMKTCVPITPLSIAEVVEGDGKYVIIDSIPYWYLKERYGIALDSEQDRSKC